MSLSRTSSSTSLAGQKTNRRQTFEDWLIIGLAGLANIQNSYKKNQNNKPLFGLYALEEDFRNFLEQCISSRERKPMPKIQSAPEIREAAMQSRKEEREQLGARYAKAIEEEAKRELNTYMSLSSQELQGILSKQSIRVQRIIKNQYKNIYDEHKAAVEAVIIQHTAVAQKTCADFERRAKTGITQDNSPVFLQWYREVQEYQSKTTENANLIIRKTHPGL
jgi:hypothetical protein